MTFGSNDPVATTIHEGDRAAIHINSTGLAILFELILHPSKHFRKVFDIVRLSRDVPVFASEEAVKTVEAP